MTVVVDAWRWGSVRDGGDLYVTAVICVESAELQNSGGDRYVTVVINT